jgi:hypothetical protein
MTGGRARALFSRMLDCGGWILCSIRCQRSGILGSGGMGLGKCMYICVTRSRMKAEKRRRLTTNYNLPSKTAISGPELLDMHSNYVRSCVSPDRLFFFNVRDGWEPLCKILKVPMPDEPFPRANDGQAMQDFFKNLVVGAMVRWLQVFAVTGLGIAIAMYVWKSR